MTAGILIVGSIVSVFALIACAFFAARCFADSRAGGDFGQIMSFALGMFFSCGVIVSGFVGWLIWRQL